MKVLLVDDSKVWRKILSDFFSSKGYSVEIAADGLEAYFKIYEILPDAIVSDVMMPGLNGYQLCRITRMDSKLRKMPFVLLTGSGDSVSKFWSVYAGADAYIDKGSTDALERTDEVLKKTSGKWKGNIERQNGRIVFETFLDKLLTDTTLRAEMRALSNHVEDMDYTVQKMEKFLKDMFEADSFSLLVLSVDELLLYTPVDDTQKMEKFLLSHLKRPYFPKLRTHRRIEGSRDVNEMDSEVKAISFENEEIGVLALWRKSTFSFKETNILSIIAQELGGILKNGIQIKQYKRGAYIDDLTGIANFRALEKHLEDLWKTRKEFELSILDIDHFKLVNDTYGHETGNEVLSGLGKLLKEFAEESGTFVGRFGGEEFMLVKEGGGLTKEVEMIRKSVEHSKFSSTFPQLSITISAGVATRDDSKSVTEIIESADAMLYQAKESGRNTVMSYENIR